MKKPSEKKDKAKILRDRVIGLGENSFHKSYYPQLLSRIEELEASKKFLESKSKAMTEMIKNLELAQQRTEESEKKYRELADSLPQVIFETDVDGNIMFFNKNALEVFRFESDIEPGRLNAIDLLVPEDRERAGKNFKSILRGRSSKGTEYTAYRNDGTQFPVSIHSTRFLEDGKPVGLRGILIDLTEQKRSAAALRESENKYHSLFEYAGDAILILKDKIIIDCNRMTLRLFDLKAKDLINKPLDSLLYRNLREISDKETDLHERITAAEEGTAQFFEVQFKAGESGYFDAEVRLSSLELDMGRFVQVIIRDISNKKRADRLITMFNSAALSLEVALTQQEIFNTIAADLHKLDFNCSVFMLEDDRKTLSVSNLSYDKELIERVENQAGLKILDMTIPINSAGELEKAIYQKKTVFIPNTKSFIGHVLEKLKIPNAKKTVLLFTNSKLIIAPLVTDNEVIGILVVQSDNLEKGDNPFVSVFAYHLSGALRRAELYEKIKMELEARQLVEDSLKKERDLLKRISETSPAGICLVNREGEIVYANRQAEKVLGLKKSDILHRSYDDVEWRITDYEGNEFPKKDLPFNLVRHTKEPVFNIRHAIEWENGKRILLSINAAPLLDNKHSFDGMVATVADVTEQKRMESQLQQSQKLEAIGQLASGVAHDFNNVLTAITGFTQLAAINAEPGTKTQSHLNEVIKACGRASNLTNQLLAFGRKQIIEPIILEINTVMADMKKMLKRLISEAIELKYSLGSDIEPIKADIGQIEQIVVNLVVNARDALNSDNKNPQKPVIHIETEKVYLDRRFVADHLGSREGKYVCIRITDNGTGISEKTLANIFEPFFTTKPKGKGTGLGLSTVYGIVKQNGGIINVKSEEGIGTTFNIFWPVFDEIEKIEKKDRNMKLERGRSETILIIEDEEQVLNMAAEVMRSVGYQVLCAPNGETALEIAKTSTKEIDLVFTDVVMPEMSGKQIAQKLESEFPGIKILFASGYSDDLISGSGILEKGINFIHKPYTPEKLTRTVRKILDNV